MRSKVTLAALLSLAATAGLAQTAPAREPGAPMSAIGWLGQGDANVPTVLRRPSVPLALPPLDEPPITASGATPEVEVRPLGAPAPGSAGLLPMSVTGLPRSLWTASDTTTLTSLLAAVDPAVPALSALILMSSISRAA